MGPVVRYGPNRLLFNSRESLEGECPKQVLQSIADFGSPEIYGHHRNFFKGRAYDAMRIQPVPSVFNAASNELHSQRRKIVAQGFSDQAVKASEPKILKQIDAYRRVLFPDEGESSWSEPRELTSWSAFFAIDLIADLAVGRSTEMLTSPENRVFNPARKANFKRMGLAMQWPEVFLSNTFRSLKIGEIVYRSVAEAGKQWHALLNSWIATRIAELREDEKESRSQGEDMVSAVMRYRDPETGENLNDADLTAELTTLLIAGSGTITTGMTSLFWYLSRSPEAYGKASAEVRRMFRSSNEIRIGTQLSSCEYLRACLSESMRVSPAPTTPLYREAGKGGATVCGTFIPEGSEVATTIYALHHNELYHPDSFQFDPNRWLDKEAAAKTKSAWAPFSHGPRNCIGLNLAVNEVLLAMATILWHGDFRIAGDEKLATVGEGRNDFGPGRRRESEFQMFDTFGASTDGPYLQFRIRAAN
ncbi:hypothetical protein PRZ48_006152 [Zasmidium cellare]|uniref:Cytochrome P450 n=1 Tax=Zasmidium cellare TaxID=395010 RepID=A0ABR0EMB3_ZASCE|nr:hypothetical protein PRZ48_006152 [Zasmidium cellare]